MTDSEDKNFLVDVADWFEENFSWFVEALSSATVRNAVYSDAGITASNGAAAVPDDLKERLSSVDKFVAGFDPEKPNREAFLSTIRDLEQAYWAFEGVMNAHGNLEAEVITTCYRLLTLNYLRLRAPFAYWFAQPFGFIGESFSSQLIPRPAAEEIRDVFSEIKHNLALLCDRKFGEFFNSPLATESDAAAASHWRLGPLAVALGFLYPKVEPNGPAQVLYGWERDPESTTPLADQISQRMLSFAIPKRFVDPSGAQDQVPVSVTIALVPEEHGGPGTFIAFGGANEVKTPLGENWEFLLELSSSDAIDFFIRDWTDIDVHAPEGAGASARLTLRHNSQAATVTRHVIDIGVGVKLEFGRAAITAELSADGPSFVVHFSDSALVIGSESDVVAEKLIQTERLRIDFQLGLGFKRGKFFIEGGAGLNATIPLSFKLGPVSVQSITLGIAPVTTGESDLLLECSATFVAKFDAISFTAQRIGLKASLANHSLDFQPPKGIGIAIKTDRVSGGGFIFIDSDAHRYAGVLNLNFKDAKQSLTALGVLNTRINGEKAFSFLAVIAAQSTAAFDPQLGFQINGFGGILGFHRTIDLEVLKAGLKSKILDDLLFPEDPIVHAARLIDTISAVFPPMHGHHVFGLMVKMSWGKKNLITLDLGVVAELNGEGISRIVLLGQLRVYFPTEEHAIVRIEVDALGYIDFEKREAFLHLVIITGKLVTFTLAGEAAALVRWGGEEKEFAISFGGFNPRYQTVMQGFPKLPRLSIDFYENEGLDVDITAYLAVTSNSFQIGGSVNVKAGTGKFTLEGSVSVDALFIDDNPCVILDLDASVALKVWGHTLFKIQLKGTLSGTSPWCVEGKATFEILWFDHSIPFHKEFSGSELLAALPPIAVLPELITILRDERSWRAELPDLDNQLVVLRPVLPASGVLLHPNGGMVLNQTVVPLDVDIQRFGRATPQGQNRFSILAVNIGSAPAQTEKVEDHFARSLFFEMSEDERLSSPSFERMTSGVRIKTDRIRFGAASKLMTEFETMIYNAGTDSFETVAPSPVRNDVMFEWLKTGAVAFTILKTRPSTPYSGPEPFVKVGRTSWTVRSKEDLSLQDLPGLENGRASTFTEAVDAVRAHGAANGRDLQVIGSRLRSEEDA